MVKVSVELSVIVRGTARSGLLDKVMPTLKEIEQAYILQVLDYAQGNKSEAARILGIDRTTLHYKLQGLVATAAQAV